MRSAEEHAAALAKSVTDITFSMGRVFDACASEMADIQSLVIQRLQGHKVPPEGPERDDFVARSFAELYPAIVNSEVGKNIEGKILAHYEKLPTTGAIRLKKTPEDRSIGCAVVFGLALGTAVVGGICLYLALKSDK